jgi:ATP-binding cassette subfamily C protein
LGPHHELIEAGGAYAALWRSWHGDRPTTAPEASAAAAGVR